MHKPRLGTVSHGTTRHQDLIPLFLAELRRIDPEGLASVESDTYPIPDYVVSSYNPSGHEWWYSDEADVLLTRLFETLDELAPVDHYFGAHWGDGCDFGYWPIEEEV